MYETIPKNQALRIRDHIKIQDPDVTWTSVTKEEAGGFVRATGLPWKWASKVLEGGGVITLAEGYMRKRADP